MPRFVVGFTLAAVVCQAPAAARAIDWLTAPSYYTHHPVTAQRVHQFAPPAPSLAPSEANFQRSAYRHSRGSLQIGDSVDHYHVVEEYGRPVRPYDEWRFPYRPYSVPYPLWGPPYAGLGGWGSFAPGPFPPGPFPPGPIPPGAGAAPGYGPFQPYGPGYPPPYLDGTYFDIQRQPRFP